MNNSFTLQQISRTSNLDLNLISRQYKLDLMSKVMCIKFENQKMKLSETANQLGYSTSTLQRYRNDKKMLSPYRIHPNNTNKQQKKRLQILILTSIYVATLGSKDLKRPQMTSKDLNWLQMKIVGK